MTDTTLKTVQALVAAVQSAIPKDAAQSREQLAALTAGRALIAQMQREAVQPGWKLVPVEPTDEMDTAAENDYEQAFSHLPDWKRTYRAMLAAAPHPEAQALDSQLQQPDGHSTRASGVCATTPRWIERWHGSGPDRGWWVWETDHGNPVAYIGEGDHSERLTSILVEKHNEALDSTGEASAQQQDDHAGSPAPSEPVAQIVQPLGEAPKVIFYSMKALHAAHEMVGAKLYTHSAPLESNAYPLPDDLYPGSKDWLAADYAGRVEWLHVMYESARKEVDMWCAQVGESREPCYCDKQGIGEPGVSCGDCPTRDYKESGE